MSGGRRTRAGEPCLCCGVTMTRRPAGRSQGPTDHKGHGYCRRDYDRWRNAGFPAGGPPAEPRERTWLPHHDRVEDYLFLTGAGLTRRQIAQRLGVTLRSVERWAAAAARDQAAA